MNEIGRQLIKISQQIIAVRKPIPWEAVIKKHFKLPEDRESEEQIVFDSIMQFANTIGQGAETVRENLKKQDSELNQLLDTYKITINIRKAEPIVWKNVIRDHFKLPEDRESEEQIVFDSITQFANTIGKYPQTVLDNLNKQDSELNQLLDTYKIKINIGEPNKPTDWEDILKNYFTIPENRESEEQIVFDSVKQFAKAIGQETETVLKNLKKQDSVLNQLLDTYKIKINIGEPNKPIVWEDILKNYFTIPENRESEEQIVFDSVRQFAKKIKLEERTVLKNLKKQDSVLNQLLNKYKITFNFRKPFLQRTFQEAILELDNVVRVDTQVSFDGKSQLSGIENLIKKSEIILNRKNQIAKKIKSSTNNNDKESESLDRLTNLLNNLTSKLKNIHNSAFDFYVETKDNKYLIQCQGEQHYDLNKDRTKNIIDRILIDSAKMLFAAKHNCNFIATYDVKAKKQVKSSLDVFNDFYMTTEEAIQLIKNEGTIDKRKVKRCAITMINRIRKKFEDRIDQLSQKIKEQIKTNREILEQIRQY